MATAPEYINTIDNILFEVEAGTAYPDNDVTLTVVTPDGEEKILFLTPDEARNLAVMLDFAADQTPDND